jgi:hypothetical protein
MEAARESQRARCSPELLMRRGLKVNDIDLRPKRSPNGGGSIGKAAI